MGNKKKEYSLESTEAKKEYSRLLASPRWRVTRDRICHRDGYRCVNCGERGEGLNVHHRYYMWHELIKPWSYGDECLLTLCRKCHEDVHKYREEVGMSQFIPFESKSGVRKGKKVLITSFEVHTLDSEFDFGKYNGSTIREVIERDFAYFKWFVIFMPEPLNNEAMDIFFSGIKDGIIKNNDTGMQLGTKTMGRKEIEEDVHGPKKIKSKEPRELRLRDILYFGKYMAWSIGNVIKESWEYVEWLREKLGFWYSDEVRKEVEREKKNKRK